MKMKMETFGEDS